MTTRRHATTVDAVVLDLPGAGASPMVLGAPGPGWFVAGVRRGQVVGPGEVLGELDRLGRRMSVCVPASAAGAVVGLDAAHARIAVGYRDALCSLDASVAAVGASVAAAPDATTSADGLVFRAPSSGRFYGRPGPGKPAFVSVGDVIATGHTLCMLEVMKTFHRVGYGGPGLPERARVEAILVADEADVVAGDALLRLAPA